MKPIQIIMIDNYDSFTFNLVDLFRQFDIPVLVFRNDVPVETIFKSEQLQDKQNLIVLSPGPGNPDSAGNTLEILKRYSGILPILGICLGHQAIIQHFNGSVGHARQIVHGKADKIYTQPHPVFAEISNPFTAARYHSLSASKVPDELQIIANSQEEVMAIAHKQFKILSFQFHPESILTASGGQLLKNSIEWLCDNQNSENKSANKEENVL